MTKIDELRKHLQSIGWGIQGVTQDVYILFNNLGRLTNICVAYNQIRIMFPDFDVYFDLDKCIFDFRKDEHLVGISESSSAYMLLQRLGDTK